MKIRFNYLLFVLCLLLLPALQAQHAYAFSQGGCEGDCRKCHALSNKEANGILKKMNIPGAKIIDVQQSPVKSLWEISIDDKGKRGIFYVDFSKQYVIPGPIVEVGTGSNKTMERLQKMQPERKVDASKIPLSGALVMGNKNAVKKVIVFTDPDCPFCAKLHQEIRKVLGMRKDIAFFIKLFPLAGHKDAYWKAKSISCSKSLKMLDDNFGGKAIARKECAGKEIDDNIRLAGSLGITGTPTLILPGGRVHSGTLPADKLIGLIDGRR